MVSSPNDSLFSHDSDGESTNDEKPVPKSNTKDWFIEGILLGLEKRTLLISKQVIRILRIMVHPY